MTNTIRTLVTTFALTFAALFGSPALAASPELGDRVQVDDGERPAGATTLEGQININTASVAELEMLPGVGPAIAERIVSFRTEHPFQQRNHIMRVKGIGQKTFDKIKDFLIVEGETTLRAVK
jgi:competence protein ComEA